MDRFDIQQAADVDDFVNQIVTLQVDQLMEMDDTTLSAMHGMLHVVDNIIQVVLAYTEPPEGKIPLIAAAILAKTGIQMCERAPKDFPPVKLVDATPAGYVDPEGEYHLTEQVEEMIAGSIPDTLEGQEWLEEWEREKEDRESKRDDPKED